MERIKVTDNSFCTTTFTYEIRRLNPLTQTLLLSHYKKYYFFHTLHKNVVNYSTLSTTFYIGFRFRFIHSEPIAVTPMKENRRRKHVNKFKNNREVTYMNNVGYHAFLDKVIASPL
jgi:hypothetical protein